MYFMPSTHPDKQGRSACIEMIDDNVNKRRQVISLDSTPALDQWQKIREYTTRQSNNSKLSFSPHSFIIFGEFCLQ